MMHYGHVCFSYSKGEFVPRAIAWFTGSQWSHTFITVPPMLGRELAMECGAGGIEMVTFDVAYRKNPGQKYEVYRVKASQEVIDRAIFACLDKLEQPYGYLEYPWFIWRSINRWFGRDIKGQDNWSKRRKVCAGFVDFYLDELRWQELSKDYGWNSINAQDIYEIVKAHPELFELVESKSDDGYITTRSLP